MEKKIVYPYIPNSAPEVQAAMLAEVGAKDTMELYEEIPESLRLNRKLNLPEPILDEAGIKRHVNRILAKNKNCLEYDNFLGAGCANHYVPAICDEITGRAELLTSYSAAALVDHGKHQIFFEYQSLMAELLEMDFLTLACHCGGQAVASSLCMSNRMNGRKKVLLPRTMTPQNLLVAKNYLASVNQDKALEIVMVDYDPKTGRLDLADLKQKLDEDVSAVLLENPNFLGVIEEDAEEIGRLVNACGAEYIVYVDPITLGVMEAPGNYGATLAIGDLHGLGLHLYAGGAQGGFIASKDEMRYIVEFKDQVAGIIATKEPGEIGFAPVLFDRTHYALREKGKEFTGTQNCLWMAPAAVYLSLMGAAGMEEVARTITTHALYAAKKLASLPNVSLHFPTAFFKEFVLDFSATGKTVAEINKQLLDYNIFGGFDLSADYPELGQCSLVCVTEMNDKESIDRLVAALTEIVGSCCGAER